MHIRAEAIILSTRNHGEHGVVARALTRADGVQPGYVRGGRSRQLRPVLQPANLVMGEWRARTEEQLPALTVEPLASRASLHREPLAAGALEWATALTAASLPEGQAYPRLYDGLGGLIGAIAAAPLARDWAMALVLYERLLLAEMGFGLDLSVCVVTGVDRDLAFVSPRSGAAVTRGAAVGYETKLMRLPPFLRDGGVAGWPDILDGLALTGHFLARDVLVDRRVDVLSARVRLVERLKRAVA